MVKTHKKYQFAKRMISVMAMMLLVFTASLQSLAASEQTDTHIKLVLDAQGGRDGTSEIYVESGGVMPTITPPVRRGYDFLGYYSAASGQGTQYYNADGSPAATNCGFSDTAGLYAFWKVHTYQITYKNMADAVFGDLHPDTYTYGISTKVSDPTRDGYEFFGWQINDSPIASQGMTIGAGDYAMDLALTAIWNKAHLVTVQNNTTTTVTISDSDLQEVFRRQVSNPLYGVTADDLNSDEVRLIMTASDKTESAEGAADIIGAAQGEVLKFYDFTVTKSVTKQGEDTVESGLTELPNTVQVEITLDEDLCGRTGYRVYRYHDGHAGAIPMGPVTDSSKTKESYVISEDGTTITIYTRRLSTYAIVGSQKELSGSGIMQNGASALDVQAQVLEGGGAVYGLDITWGPMRFTYSTGREWDPETHRYTDVRIYDWIPEECYAAGNNEVTIYNHSNADVIVDFIATPLLKEGANISLLDGVDMVINTTNTAQGVVAKKVLLQRVPMEGADARSVTGYLRLNGSPSDPDFYKGLVTSTETGYEDYVKVASIAVTIQYTDSAKTPRKSS